MAKNQYSPLENSKIPAESVMSNLVQNMSYVRLPVDQLPDEIRQLPLVKKFNSALVSASASEQGICFNIIGLRPDEGNTVIDEHPIPIYYDKVVPSRSFWGIIHHGNWPDRTYPLPTEVTQALASCGLTAEFTYKGIPPGSSGALLSLSGNNMLAGFLKQQDLIHKNRK